MAIAQDEIKILKSERLSDTADGGGRITGDEVVDGVPNDVFPDIGDIDRATGRVRLRKLYGAVQSQNTDLFVNGNFMLSRPPSDADVHSTIFTTRDWADERTNAQNRLESYLTSGPTTQLIVLGTQIAGGSAVIAYTIEGNTLPEVGDTIVLSEEDLATGAITAQQFVRVTAIEAEVQQFSGLNGATYERQIVTLELSTPLNRTFPGAVEVVANSGSQPSPTLIRETRVAAAQRYFGITPITSAPSLGGFAVQGESILTQLVPSTSAETALVDQFVAQPTGAAQAAGDPLVETRASVQVDAGAVQTIFTARPILPGSLTVEFAANSDTGFDYEGDDQGDGTLDRTAGGASTADVSATVDYADGAISLSGFGGAISSIDTVTLTYTPAVIETSLPESGSIPIDENNRGRSYAVTIPSQPGLGTLRVQYRGLGRWYTLRDNADGTLSGPAGAGVGTFNFATNTLLLTLGVEPDIGTAIIIEWGTREFTDRADGDLAQAIPVILFSAGENMKPGSVVIEWDVGATTFTATDTNGTLTGDATGTVDYASGEVRVLPSSLPPVLTTFSLAYNRPDGTAHTNAAPGAPSLGAGTATFTIPNAPLQPGTVEFSTQHTETFNHSRGAVIYTVDSAWYDSGAGTLTNGRGGSGTVDYATGEASITIPAVARGIIK